jgi:cysteine rich repeat protein
MMRTSLLGLVLILACAPLAACNQHQANKREAVHERERGGHGGLRQTCAADLDKYCSSQARGRERRNCLQEHMDQLSADCKAAVQARAARHRKRDF